jgi:hypothetical protein
LRDCGFEEDNSIRSHNKLAKKKKVPSPSVVLNVLKRGSTRKDEIARSMKKVLLSVTASDSDRSKVFVA